MFGGKVLLCLSFVSGYLLFDVKIALARTFTIQRKAITFWATNLKRDTRQSKSLKIGCFVVGR
jgi:hypothetical protein